MVSDASLLSDLERQIRRNNRSSALFASRGGHQLTPIVARLASRLKIVLARVMVMDDAPANAFAAGSRLGQTTVVFTTGLLGLLNDHDRPR